MQTPNRRWTALASVAFLAASLALLAVAAPATAHTCKSEDHAGCDSHHCPDDGQTHNHRHDVHWWRDHGCVSSPSANTFCAVMTDTGCGDGIYYAVPAFGVQGDGGLIEAVQDTLAQFLERSVLHDLL